ncbi:hypothetical protein GF327_08170 [Candidatus Woesearchaeota archaeon]|nr:hypothetical protein [Candidatus Woesearchaeota archaeon]
MATKIELNLRNYGGYSNQLWRLDPTEEGLVTRPEFKALFPHVKETYGIDGNEPWLDALTRTAKMLTPGRSLEGTVAKYDQILQSETSDQSSRPGLSFLDLVAQADYRNLPGEAFLDKVLDAIEGQTAQPQPPQQTQNGEKYCLDSRYRTTEGKRLMELINARAAIGGVDRLIQLLEQEGQGTQTAPQTYQTPTPQITIHPPTQQGQVRTYHNIDQLLGDFANFDQQSTVRLVQGQQVPNQIKMNPGNYQNFWQVTQNPAQGAEFRLGLDNNTPWTQGGIYAHQGFVIFDSTELRNQDSTARQNFNSWIQPNKYAGDMVIRDNGQFYHVAQTGESNYRAVKIIP